MTMVWRCDENWLTAREREHRNRDAMTSVGMRSVVFGGCMSFYGCQNPTDPDDVVNFDEVVDVTASPDPIIAACQTSGRTYRVVRGNNQPDEILAYDWHT
jgi:hypothetical protein